MRDNRAPSNGAALGLRIPVGFGFDSPTGYSIRTWRSLGSRLVGDQETAGSNPAVLTEKDKRAEVQMGARLLREQEPSWLFAVSAAGGSTPLLPDLNW